MPDASFIKSSLELFMNDDDVIGVDEMLQLRSKCELCRLPSLQQLFNSFF